MFRPWKSAVCIGPTALQHGDVSSGVVVEQLAKVTFKVGRVNAFKNAGVIFQQQVWGCLFSVFESAAFSNKSVQPRKAGPGKISLPS